MIGVLFHQLEGPLQACCIEKPDRRASAHDEVTEAIGPCAAGREHVECLGEDRNSREERLPEGLENLSTTSVGRVFRIEERDQWPGVDQDHRRSFRRMAA